jgi:hypothetical protein
MNRYHRGSSMRVHVGTQLKVENPFSVRTIWNFDLLRVSASVLSLQANAY